MPFTVVGVIDPSFTGLDVGRAVQIYTPLCSVPTIDGRPNELDERSNWFLTIVARPLAGTTIPRTQVMLAAAAPGVSRRPCHPVGRPRVRRNT